MNGLKPLLVFLSMLIVFPLLFSLAFVLWQIYPAVALLILFVGLAADVLIGFRLFDRTLNLPG